MQSVEDMHCMVCVLLFVRARAKWAPDNLFNPLLLSD